MNEVKQKKWWVALILLLTLGTIGAHRFYMGQPQLGYNIFLVGLATLLVGFPALVLIPWLVIDFVLIFFKIAKTGYGQKLI